MQSPLPRRNHWVPSSFASPAISVFPQALEVDFRIAILEVCSAFTHVIAYVLAKSPCVTLCIEGFSRFVTSTTAPIATGWNDSSPGGIRTR